MSLVSEDLVVASCGPLLKSPKSTLIKRSLMSQMIALTPVYELCSVRGLCDRKKLNGHPWPHERFAVNHPRWKPGARIAPAGFCAGGAQDAYP